MFVLQFLLFLFFGFALLDFFHGLYVELHVIQEAEADASVHMIIQAAQLFLLLSYHLIYVCLLDALSSAGIYFSASLEPIDSNCQATVKILHAASQIAERLIRIAILLPFLRFCAHSLVVRSHFSDWFIE